MGTLASFSLRNRALVALATVIVAVFGVISLNSLKLELIPNLQFPVVGVVAPYPGASPEAVEQEVTTAIEDAVAGVDGLEEVTSTSSSGTSAVLVSLAYGTDLSRVQQEIETELSGLDTLPESVEPVVFSGDFDQFPIVQLAVTSDLSAAELAEEVERIAVPRLEEIEGVRGVELTGAPTTRVEIELKPEGLALGVTGESVRDALQAAALLPVGSVDDGAASLSVQVGSTPATLDQLRRVPVQLGSPAQQPGQPGQSGPGAGPAFPQGSRPLSDVAEVRVAQAEATSFSRTNGLPSLALGITKTPDGNTVDISHEIRDLMPELEEELGDEAELTVAFDQAPFIEKSVEDLTTEGALGLVFAVLVILLFLFSVRSTLVTAISIPLSLLVTLIGLELGGFSLNILTLGALTVAIGRVVDDSIVVIENIKRHLSYGEEKAPAIVAAVREVAGAITSSTIATAAVFLPIGIVGGQVGELFRPFAVTVALALLASLLVALTIIPVLASWFLKVPEAGAVDVEALQREAEEKEERTWLRRGYDPVLRWALGRPWVTVALAMVLLLGTVALTPLIKTNFLGATGQNTLTVTQELEAGANLARQDDAARAVEEILADVEEVDLVQASVGGDPLTSLFGGGATQFALTLDEESDADAVADELRDLLEEAPGDLVVTAGDSGFSSALEVVVTATEQDNLLEAAEQVTEELQGVEGIGEVTSDASPAQPVLRVEPRPEALQAGLTAPAIGGQLAQVLSQPPLTQVTLDGEQLDVVLDTGAKPTSVEQLRTLPLADGTPLDSVAEVERSLVASAITRADGERTVTISAEPAADDLGSVTREVDALLADLDLPEGTDVSLGGVAEDQAEAFAQLGLALVVAIAIVYLVMVGTFNSLVQPLILLVSVPFAATGALLLLWVTGIPLGVASLIGALMLVGIVVTNAIVLIDLVNQYRERGASMLEALYEGGGKRLRPIVMTALATILALTPMGLGLTGGSAFISQPLAVVVIGGLLSSTLLTLILVPVLYLLVERRKERRQQRRGHRRSGAAATA